MHTSWRNAAIRYACVLRKRRYDDARADRVDTRVHAAKVIAACSIYVMLDAQGRLTRLRVAALLMGTDGGFITGSDFLMDGGVTASYWYGELAPERAAS
jgi:hypothetical protein